MESDPGHLLPEEDFEEVERLVAELQNEDKAYRVMHPEDTVE